ncbi:hypothetical protein VZT92_023797 [Zoarces viviparus]|uniref:Uncharacterized protein n=1 Tax=Zoarces viviparus TaxID=48416 RepID=A0AAW1E7K8_ZOAVI
MGIRESMRNDGETEDSERDEEQKGKNWREAARWGQKRKRKPQEKQAEEMREGWRGGEVSRGHERGNKDGKREEDEKRALEGHEGYGSSVAGSTERPDAAVKCSCY